MSGNGDNGNLGRALGFDALEGWANGYVQFGQGSVRIGGCVLKCAMNEFVGSSVTDLVINAHEKAFEKAIEDAAKEAGIKCLGKASSVLGALLTVRDLVKTGACSLECR